MSLHNTKKQGTPLPLHLSSAVALYHTSNLYDVCIFNTYHHINGRIPLELLFGLCSTTFPKFAGGKSYSCVRVHHATSIAEGPFLLLGYGSYIIHYLAS